MDLRNQSNNNPYPNEEHFTLFFLRFILIGCYSRCCRCCCFVETPCMASLHLHGNYVCNGNRICTAITVKRVSTNLYPVPVL